MPKPLLVPLDGSMLAEHALPYAAGLARAIQARLILLHARWTAVLPDEGAPDLDAIASRLRTGGIDVDTHVRDMLRGEDAGRTILEAATDLDAGLIVMATHGRGGLGRLIFGSVADQVIRQAALPVVLIPPAAARPWPDDRPPRVLVPLDGSSLAEEVLVPVQDLVTKSGAELIVLRVAESIDYARPHGDDCEVCRLARARGEEPDIEPVRVRRYVEDIAARLQAAGVTAEPQMEIGPAASTITRIAQERDVDLIAMATNGRGGLARLVLGSVATATLRQTTVPVLLVRPTAVRPPETGRAGAAAAPEMGRDPVKVKDIMSEPVVTVGEDATLEQIARLMLDKRIGGVPVVDPSGRLVGIITESDFTGKETYVPFTAYKLPQVFGEWIPREGVEAIYREARTKKARDIMSTPVTTTIEDEPISALVRRMVEQDIKRLPVVRGAVPIGMVSRHDLLQMITATPADH